MPMKKPFDPTSWAMPSDITSVIEAQRQGFDAMAKAGQIMAEAIRTCAERHVKAAQGAFEDLVKVKPTSLSLSSPEEAWRQHASRMQGAMDRMAAHMGELQRVMTEAQMAAIEELQTAWGKAAPDAMQAVRMVQDEATKLTRNARAEAEQAVKKVQDAAAELMKATPMAAPKPAAPAAAPAAPAPEPAKAAAPEEEAPPVAKPAVKRAPPKRAPKPQA